MMMLVVVVLMMMMLVMMVVVVVVMVVMMTTHEALSVDKGAVDTNKREVAEAAVVVLKTPRGVGGVGHHCVGRGGVVHHHVGGGGVLYHVHLKKVLFCMIRQVEGSHIVISAIIFD